ncbi:MAG: 50S ribosomal protein L18 [Candidatus Nanoarchaeia archaeon]|nr:50S ribosomal protein L18 [Candidatus Nanoarchaeia archaeon]MDD5587718.1 50S ribosomal protein L18 [Candidatus Nanoarchaeia archaeon]
MKQQKRFKEYKRKSERRTDYRTRLKLLSSGKTRLVIRKTLNNIIIQFVDYSPKGDKVLVSCNSCELKKLGWKANTGNVPAAYLTGLLAGAEAKKKNIKKAILDMGLFGAGERIYAALKGVVDSKIEIPHTDEIYPSEDRIQGKHIINYSQNTKNKLQFSKNKPEKLKEEFEDLKNKIMKM